MKLAFISSVHWLELGGLGDIEFCLAHLAKERGDYFEYFRSAAQRGRFVLLDNGAAEGELIDNDALFELVLDLTSSEVVAPDVLYDGPATVDATRSFIDHMGYRAARMSVMAVPQGKTGGEYLACASELAATPEVDVLGLSKYSVAKCFASTAPPLYSPQPAAPLVTTRWRAIQMLEYLGKPMHLLGGDFTLPQEIQNVWNHPSVRSNDSAYAYWLACRGLEVEEGRIVLVGSSDLEHNPNLNERRRAIRNTATLLGLAKGERLW